MARLARTKFHRDLHGELTVGTGLQPEGMNRERVFSRRVTDKISITAAWSVKGMVAKSLEKT